ncbi:MAG: hypothetical protein PHG82_03795 [Candidatus Gracilibacteria bacterium]|nr:hypothetical protein [Candidatus Gracilibacteria bacterium]
MLKQTIKKGIIFGLSAGLTMLIIGATYAAWTALSTETDGGTLTSTKWNAVINRLNSIDQRQLATAWINFNGVNCSSGAGANECIINSSYNVSKVIRLGVGRYEVQFLSPMDNSNYSISASNIASTIAYYASFFVSDGTVNTTNAFRLQARNVNSSLYDQDSVNIQVFGGK